MTSLGTKLYFDTGHDRVRHGRAGSVPGNLTFAADAATVMPRLAGAPDRPMACAADGTLRLALPGETGPQVCGTLALQWLDSGAVGLRRDDDFLGAEPDGTLRFTAGLTHDAQLFRLAPATPAPANGRRCFYVDLDRGHGQARMATVRSRHDVPPFYIWAPGYTPYHGGVVVLHLLCHFLNHLGVEAYLSTDRLSGAFHTPPLTAAVTRAHAEAGRLPVCLYPEIVLNNHMGGARVARFLLNRPGQRGLHEPTALDAFWSLPQRRQEFLLDYAAEFKDASLPSHTLFVPLIDDRLFHLPATPVERRGYLVYSHRVTVTPEMIPSWARPFTMIEMQNRRTPQELGALYRQSEGLIVFERTGAQLEAAMCGCPVLAVPGHGMPDIPMRAVFGSNGVGWGTALADLERARETLPSFHKAYRDVADGFLDALAQAVGEMMDFFATQSVAR